MDISEEYFLLNDTSPRSIEENWHFFHYHFTEVINDNVPSKFAHKRTHLPWMTVELQRLIRKKQHVYNRMKTYHQENDRTECKMLQKRVSQMLKSQHKSYITNIMSSTNDKKPFWQYIKTKRQENVGVNTLKSTDEKAITNAFEKANILNQYFKSVFVTENSDTFPSKPNSPYPPIEITTQGVYNILQNLNSYKSPGPDNVHPYALKATSMEISPMLTHLFQQSLNSGILPAQWKHAHITPIHKKGDRTNPKNYRPISLTSVVCKTMEHVIVSQLTKHLEMNKILTKNQFGFREHHSCESQLFVTVDDIARAINNKLQIDVAVLDFSKAFDKVAHSRLVHKLEYYGVREEATDLD